MKRILSLPVTIVMMMVMIMGMMSFGAITVFAETLTADYVDADGNTQTATNVTEITNGGNYLPGWYILRGTQSLETITFAQAGEVHLIIENGADVTVNGGILTYSFLTPLTIYGQPTDADEIEGKLTVTGSQGSAGIGSDNESICGNITINGCIVTATGSQGGAGIGAGNEGTCDNIIINRGSVIATGSQGGAAMGAGSKDSSCDDIIINGGSIIANGGEWGAGIGTGVANINEESRCRSITINGGIVTANGGYYGAGIGSGYDKNSFCGNITLNGGTVTAKSGVWGAGIGSGYDSNCDRIFINGGCITAMGEDIGAGIGSGYKGRSRAITISGTPTIKAGDNAEKAKIVDEYNGQHYVNVIYGQSGGLINPDPEQDSGNPATGYTNHGTFWILLMFAFVLGFALYGVKKFRNPEREIEWHS